MKKKIILTLIQDLNELLEIKEKKFNAIFLPLDFATLLYCKKNQLNHLNPIDFLDNKLHRVGILQHAKAKKVLNWEPKIKIEDGIEKLYNWISSQTK